MATAEIMRAAKVSPIHGPNRVVVIVGSSGSLTPLREIVEALRPPLDAAVIVLTHRPPDQRSYLVEILGKRVLVPVVDAVDGERLAAGCVYVAPAGDRQLRVRSDVFELARGPRIRFHRPSATALFESVAASFGARAVAVVLSGMGSNGAEGVVAIKRAGGMVLVQLAAEAECPSMPNHALQSVDVDVCAPASELALRIAALCRRADGLARLAPVSDV
ncbi:MAG TPA: chemotaxis protein CheB [Polyangia bacterium]|nr:chemotaxis protein CheB [Polyangia bacterium]